MQFLSLVLILCNVSCKKEIEYDEFGYIVEENVVKMSNMLFGNDTDNERKDYIFEMLSEGLVDLEVENSVV